MKIAACLSWYDEPAHFLDRVIWSLSKTVDTVVALDGAWKLYPGGQPYSSLAQTETLEAACAEFGLRFVGGTKYAEELWASQVAKRDALMKLAAKTDADWLFVIDADEFVERSDRELLEKLLDAATCDVAKVRCSRRDGRESSIRRLYRASAGVTVASAHNGYRTTDGRWLHGDGARVMLQPALDVSSALAIYHDHDNRSEQRNDRARAYYRERRAQQIEWQ